MPVPIILPQWGMGMNDGEIIKWLKAVGDPVANGDQLVEIESAKVNAEVESTADGTLGRIDVEAGRIVDVGTVLGYVLEAGDSESDLPDVAPVVGSASTPAPVVAAKSPSAPSTPSATPKGGKQVVTPRARRLAKEIGVDLANVTGTGPSGRVTEDDVKSASEITDSAGAKSALVESSVPVRETIKLSGLRGTIARRMSESANVPTVTLSTTADVTDLIG